MGERATIYEVAKQADVSTATVSRVLNNSPHVSEKTKQKILDVMEELNYAPQLTARNLAGGESTILAVVVPSFTTPYYNEILKGIKDEIANVDLDLMIYNTGSQFPEQGMENFFDRGMADAAIILSIQPSEDAHKKLQATQTPTVLVNSTHPAYNYFSVDDYKGGQLAAQHFIDCGYRSIGMITASDETSDSIQQRQKGFFDVLEANDVTLNSDFIMQGDSTKHAGFSEESGFEAIEKFSALDRFPEAIFCLNDTLAIGAISALSRLGKSVPDDIAVMGYDNIKLSRYYDLTTVDQKMYTIGRNSIKRVTELVNGSDIFLQESIEPELIKRGSTK